MSVGTDQTTPNETYIAAGLKLLEKLSDEQE
jgi:hypothetical protein